GDFEGDGGLPFDAREAGSGTPSLYLENCFVNAETGTDAAAILGGEAMLLYSTLAGRFQEAAPSRALFCAENTSVVVRNSLFVASDQNILEVECPSIDAQHNAAEMILGGTNTALGQFIPGQDRWFESFATGELTLNNPPPALLTAARWQPGDPNTDINGDQRPAGPGDEDVAGADVPSMASECPPERHHEGASGVGEVSGRPRERPGYERAAATPRGA